MNSMHQSLEAGSQFTLNPKPDGEVCRAAGVWIEWIQSKHPDGSQSLTIGLGWTISEGE